jgi:hypothetical protein
MLRYLDCGYQFSRVILPGEACTVLVLPPDILSWDHTCILSRSSEGQGLHNRIILTVTNQQ